MFCWFWLKDEGAILVENSADKSDKLYETYSLTVGGAVGRAVGFREGPLVGFFEGCSVGRVVGSD